MDLYAYMQIEDYESILKENNIEIPRLRGIRLMKNEELYSDEEIKTIERACTLITAESFFRASWPSLNSNSYNEYNEKINKRVNHYMVSETKVTDYGEETTYTDIRWDRVHGKRRKVLKMLIKKAVKKVRDQIDVWNKYAGKENILYIHSRIGGYNWINYGGIEISRQSWFLEKVDDGFDSTYCDIYARIE